MNLLSRKLLVGVFAVAASVAGALALPGLSAPAYAATEPVPPELRGIEIEERLGKTVPLDIPLVDHTGAKVMLRDYFQAKRPVILALNYYHCATLCSFVLNGLTDGMRALEFTPGKHYQVVTVSFDPFNSVDPAVAVTMPLFAVIILSAIFGVVAGGVEECLQRGHVEPPLLVDPGPAAVGVAGVAGRRAVGEVSDGGRGNVATPAIFQSHGNAHADA